MTSPKSLNLLAYVLLIALLFCIAAPTAYAIGYFTSLPKETERVPMSEIAKEMAWKGGFGE